jgi:hypothetical protein
LSNEKVVTIYDRLAEQNAMQAVEKMGQAMARSGMFGITKVEQGIVLALTSLMERKSVTELARKFHIIEGQLTMKASAKHAEFQANGGRVVWVETNDTACEAVFKHPDYCPKGVTVRVTMEELQRSGVAIGRNGKLKANYQKFPRQMLRARVISEGVGMVDPSVGVGVYTSEEVSDFSGQRPVRPVQDADYEEMLPRQELPVSKSAEELIPEEKHQSAIAYLQSVDWLAAGQSLADLRPGHIRDIQNRLSEFLTAVDKWEIDNAAE